MESVRSKPKKKLAFRFTKMEIRSMENWHKRYNEDMSDPNVYQRITDALNRAPHRQSESTAIQVHRVERWFLKRLKHHKTEDFSSPNSSKDVNPVDDAGMSIIGTRSSSNLPEEDVEKVSEEAEIEFEARSSRDEAWYDVRAFLSHRVLISGEIEVRVRFDGFGPEEDEWINVRNAIRARSIPMESSDCWMVNEGDLLLCFREKDEVAHHFDVHVLAIERKVHDIRGCRCVFKVQYDHDQIEERVRLSRLCRRP